VHPDDTTEVFFSPDCGGVDLMVPQEIGICPLDAVSTETGERRNLLQIRDAPLSCWFEPLGKEADFLIGTNEGVHMWKEGEETPTVHAATRAVCISVDCYGKRASWTYPLEKGPPMKLRVCSLNIETHETTETTVDLERERIPAKSVESIIDGEEYFARYLGKTRRSKGETRVLEDLVKWMGIVMKKEQGGN
jgi:hypothetical protein